MEVEVEEAVEEAREREGEASSELLLATMVVVLEAVQPMMNANTIMRVGQILKKWVVCLLLLPFS